MTATSDLRPRYDVVIVGARCAGAATALLLARSGLRVLAVDRGAYGADALSTHALMRAGVLQLARWDVLPAIRAAGTPAVRRTTFHYGADEVGVAIEPRGGVDALYAPRRTVLDRVLADAACAAGAELRFRTNVVEVLSGPGGRVAGVSLAGRDGRVIEVRANLVIGADGIKSRVAEAVGAQPYRRGKHAGATMYAYFRGVRHTGYHWYWAPETAAGIIPTNDGECCVFAGAPPARMAAVAGGPDTVFRALWGAAVAAAVAGPDPLAGAHRTTAYRTFPGVLGHVRRSYGPGWALVGDAGYFKDPLTAHGLTDALRDAELLARAAVEDTPCAYRDYQTLRDDLSEALFVTSDRIASFDWDLDRLRGLHRELVDAMRAENVALARLSPMVARAA